MTEPLDFEELEAYFLALANCNRLELLHLLRFPRPVQELRLTPRRSRQGENPDRPASRQTVQLHLAKLQEIGVVTEVDGPEKGRRHYTVNGPRLYHVMEEFRKVGTTVVGPPPARDATLAAELAPARGFEPGPKLVLVHGLVEGKAFPLKRVDLRDERGWILGRKPGLHVSLDYDPYVSLENSEILPESGGYVLADLRSSRNGTWLNWRQLADGERARLVPGDVIGVGRSLLVFRAE